MSTADDALVGPDSLDDRERQAVETLLFRLADDELVTAERFTEWQVRAPTLESDIAISNNVQDELGHARLWYDLLEDVGYEESDLIWERDPDDFTHSTMVELPFERGDWADAIVRAYFYDAAERGRLEALEGSSYPRIRDRVEKILDEEEYHLEHARNWLERLAADDDARERVQAAVDRLFPYALTLFEPVDAEVEADIDDLGLRTRPLAEQREEWYEDVSSFLTSIGVETPDAGLPDQYDVDRSPTEVAEHVGRDGDHTEHWHDLHDEMTHTYRELGRSGVRKIMRDPDEDDE